MTRPFVILACPFVFFAGLLPAALSAQSPATAATTATSPAPPVVLEPFEVTGSRVRRVDYETPSPVVTYSADTIEERGFDTLGEFMQSLPFNSGPVNADFTTGSFISGAATINPRGLGSNRALTLINGRRAVPLALTTIVNGTPATVFNFNSVPRAAIARIEILKDGASAIYGSDAITGVHNIILKKNYSGAYLDFNASNTLKHDTLNRTVSIFSGAAMRGWNVTFGASWQSRHANRLSDLGITTTDYRSLGAKGTTFVTLPNNPATVFLTAPQATAANLGPAAGYYVITGGAPTANPTKASFSYAGPTTAQIPAANFYDPAKDFALTPAGEAISTYGTVERRLTPGLTAFGQFTFNRTTSRFQLVPFEFTRAGDRLTLPAANPYNPLGLSLTNNTSPAAFTFRNLEGADRFEMLDTSVAGIIGLRGTVAKTGQWETAVSYGSDTASRAADVIRPADFQAVLNGTTRATAWNPFGPSDNPRLIADLSTRSRLNDNTIDALGYDLSGSAKVGQIPLRAAGEVGVATGYEFRRQSLRARPDPVSYLGNGPGGVPFHGERDSHSAYLELTVPLQPWLEFQLAGRHEHYSDFGRTTKPKYAAKLRLPPNRVVNVLLRGSYSESFKAPDLGQLFQKQTTVVTGALRDPLRPQDPARSFLGLAGGNPDLQPEEARVRYGGVVLEFPAIKGLSLTADYLDIEVNNVITSLSTSYLLSPDGRRQFPDAVVRDNSTQNPGPITFIKGISNNLGFQLYRGWDFGLRYALRDTRLGSFTLHADATQLIKRGSDSGQGGGFVDATGRYGAPVWRGNLSLGWQRPKLSAAVNATVIGRYFNSGFTATGWGENIFPTINASFTYRGFKQLSLTLGMNNVLDHRPPANGRVIVGFDDKIYGVGALGRTVSLRVRKKL